MAASLLVVPANNTTMQAEMDALCPHLAPFAVARVARPARTLTADDLPAYADSTLVAVQPMLPGQPELVVYSCTAAGFLGGPEGNARMTEALRRQTGATVVSTSDAMIQVLRHEGVTRVAVVTPDLPAVNDGLRRYLASAGIAVEALNSFVCETVAELGAIMQGEVREMALRTATPETTALFIAC